MGILHYGGEGNSGVDRSTRGQCAMVPCRKLPAINKRSNFSARSRAVSRDRRYSISKVSWTMQRRAKRSDKYKRAIDRARGSDKFRAWDVYPASVSYRTDSSAPPLFEEQHFTPAQLGKTWGLSDDTIREIFKNEQGVLCVGSNGSRRKRKYISMRIPESVAIRVHTRLSAKPLPVK
jgi:hypothetical protein